MQNASNVQTSDLGTIGWAQFERLDAAVYPGARALVVGADGVLRQWRSVAGQWLADVGLTKAQIAAGATSVAGLTAAGAQVDGDASPVSGGGIGALNMTARRLAIIGDSFTAPDTATSWDNGKWWVHALSELGWPYEVVAVSAAGGRAIQQMRDEYEAEVEPHAPYSEVWILPGSNNVASVAAAQAGLLALDELIAKIQTTGCKNIWVGTPCEGLDPTSTTRDALLTLYRGFQARAAAGDFTLVDTAAAYRDPAATTGAAASAYLRDPVTDKLHPGALGARRLGAAWASAVGGRSAVIASRVGDLVQGPNDCYQITQQSSRLLLNPMLYGTGGSKSGSGTITGSVPDSWNLGAPVDMTLTTTYVTESTPRARRWMRMAFAGTLGAASGATLMQWVQMADVGMVVGSRYRVRITLRASSLPASFRYCSVNANFFTSGYSPSGATSVAYDGASQYGAGELASGVVLTYETPASTALSGATQLQVAVSPYFGAGALAGYIEIADISAERLS